MKLCKYIQLLALSLMVLLAEGCSCPQDYILQKAYGLLTQHPDSALHILQSMETKRLGKTELAHYALIYTMAQDKSGLDVRSDSLLQHASAYFVHHPEDTLFHKYLYYMGKFYMLNDSTQLAEDHFLRAGDLSLQCGDYYNAYLAFEKLSRSLDTSNPELSVSYGRKALDIYRKYCAHNTYNEVYLLTNLSSSYLFNDDCDNAFRYQDEAVDLARKAQDTSLLGEVYLNRATAYMYCQNWDSALSYARLAYTSDPCPASLQCYAVNLYKKDSLQKAKVYFQALARIDSPGKYPPFRYLMDICIKENQKSQALEYADSAHAYLERMYLQAQRNNTDYYESTLRRERRLTQLTLSNQNRLWTFSSIFLIMALSFLFLLVTYQQHRRNSKRRLALEQERNRLRLEQENLRSQHEIEKREAEHRMREEMQRRENEIVLATKERQIRLMKEYILSKVATDDTIKQHKYISMTQSLWKELEQFLNITDDMFCYRLQQQYPELKERDLHLCILLRMEFTNTELSNIFCVQKDSIKKRLLMMKESFKIPDSSITFREFICKF